MSQPQCLRSALCYLYLKGGWLISAIGYRFVSNHRAAVFITGYAGLWIILAGLADVPETAKLASILAWTITGSAAIVLLPDILNNFQGISGGLLTGNTQNAPTHDINGGKVGAPSSTINPNAPHENPPLGSNIG